jgi:hypothetical protein
VDVVVAVMEMVVSAIAGLRSTINAEIDIPIVSWLYRHISGGDALTILDLLSLVVALPVTIVYKLVLGKGQAPFTDAEVAQIVSNPIPWPKLDASGAASMTLTPAQLAQAGKLDTVLATVGGVSAFFNAPIDMATDALAFSQAGELPGLSTFLSWSGLSIGMLSQGVGVPYAAMSKPEHERTPADDWSIVLWGAGLLPLGVNTVFTVFSFNQAVATFSEGYGPLISTAMGAMMEGAGIVTTVEQALDPGYSAWGEIGNVIAPIPSLCKFLLLPEEPVEFGILQAVDGVCDVGVCVTTIGGGLGAAAATA